MKLTYTRDDDGLWLVCPECGDVRPEDDSAYYWKPTPEEALQAKIAHLSEAHGLEEVEDELAWEIYNATDSMDHATAEAVARHLLRTFVIGIKNSESKEN